MPRPLSNVSLDNYNDIDFVALSYDVGFSKPDSRIFDATKKMVQEDLDHDLECLHVGDDLEKDYDAAQAAGWRSVLLDRNGEQKDHSISRIGNLTQLHRFLVS